MVGGEGESGGIVKPVGMRNDEREDEALERAKQIPAAAGGGGKGRAGKRSTWSGVVAVLLNLHNGSFG